VIILVSTDDRMLAAAARQQSANALATYGAVVAITDDPLAKLGKGEDLFICGWGSAAGPQGSPTIGNKLGARIYDAVALWQLLHGTRKIFPAGWTGRIFLWVSGSTDENPEMSFTFAEMFLTQVDAGISTQGGVYARAERVDLHDAQLRDAVIPEPGSLKWTHI